MGKEENVMRKRKKTMTTMTTKRWMAGLPSPVRLMDPPSALVHRSERLVGATKARRTLNLPGSRLLRPGAVAGSAYVT